MPPDIDRLREIFAQKNYIISVHASDRASERLIRSAKIEQAIANGIIIEDYPDDKYGPSCLIMGKSIDGRILHVQVSYPPSVKVITVYAPTVDKWEADYKTRRKS